MAKYTYHDCDYYYRLSWEFAISLMGILARVLVKQLARFSLAKFNLDQRKVRNVAKAPTDA